MRTHRTAFLAAAVALAFGLAASAPASARMHFGGGGHFDGGRWDHGGHGWGPGIDLGGNDGCIRLRPMYDAEGAYLGTQPVYVCQ